MSITSLLQFTKHIHEVIKLTIQPMTTVRLDGRFEKTFSNK